MRYLLLTLILAGCATTQAPLVTVPPVIAPDEIMLSCAEYVKPAEGTMAEFMRVVLENKKLYQMCSELNNQKKLFILEQSKTFIK